MCVPQGYLQELFPNRLQVIIGNSTTTVPTYGALQPESLGLCDLVFVDGGHEKEVAKTDLINMAPLARPR
jgi:hypothetical protein